MKTPTASSATSSQREQTFLLSQVPRSPRSNVCSTPGLENPSASIHPKRFSTPSLTPKFLCAGKLNPRLYEVLYPENWFRRAHRENFRSVRFCLFRKHRPRADLGRMRRL